MAAKRYKNTWKASRKRAPIKFYSNTFRHVRALKFLMLQFGEKASFQRAIKVY